MFSIGYNYAASSVPLQKFLLDAVKSKSNTHLIMVEPQNGIPTQNDANLIWEIYNYLYPSVGDSLRLIVRIYSNREGNWSTYPDSKIYTAIFEKLSFPPNTIIDSLANEPSLGGNSYLINENYVRHELQILRDFKNIGIDYAVGAFSTGTPHEELIERGVYDDLLKEAKYFSMHLYNQFPFEAGETHSWDIMLKTDENRALIRDIYLNNYKWGESRLGWFFGRPEWIEKRCNQLGVAVPKILITEGVFDIVTIPDNVRNNWRQNFGMPQYNYDPRGVLSWELYAKWLFPELTFDQFVQMSLRHLRDNVLTEPYHDALLLFGYNRQWGYPNGTHKESGHNIEDDKLLFFRDNLLGELNMEVILDTGSEYKTDMIWSNYSGGSNVRWDANNKSSENIAWVLTSNKEAVTIIDDNVEAESDSPYKGKWISFIKHSDGMLYYVAKTSSIEYINVEEETEEPTYIVDLLGMSEVWTSSQLKELEESFISLISLVEDIDDTDTEDIDVYLISILQEFLELRNELTDINKEKMLEFLRKILVGIQNSQQF